MFGPTHLLAALLDRLRREEPAVPWDEHESDASEDVEAEAAAANLVVAELAAVTSGKLYPVVDVEDLAAAVRYRDRKDAQGRILRRGAIKRDKYPPVDLRGRRVLIGLHQFGAQRTAANTRAHKVTATRVVDVEGTRYRVHPITCRLDAIDRFNRDPWHTLNVEFAGNFEGLDGSGNWYRPDLLGRGRATEAQIGGGRQEVEALIEEVEATGAHVEAIVPHRVVGVDGGRPSRPLCPGSRIWSEVGEWCAARFGLRVPAPGWAMPGALAIPDTWRGPHHRPSGPFLRG